MDVSKKKQKKRVPDLIPRSRLIQYRDFLRSLWLANEDEISSLGLPYFSRVSLEMTLLSISPEELIQLGRSLEIMRSQKRSSAYKIELGSMIKDVGVEGVYSIIEDILEE